MDPKVKAALVAPESFQDIGSEFRLDRPLLTDAIGNTDGYLSDVCLKTRVDTGISTSRRRVWNGSVGIQQDVYGLIGVTSAHVLDTVRAKARSCKTYVLTLNKPERVVKADVELPGLPGVDGSYGVCESMADVSERNWNCTAFISRGALVVSVSITARSEDSARAHLAVVLPRFAAGLQKEG
ncbi:hypothetical protein G7043_09195 [Lentzea sp. NEAU-D13]|uniref:PknH-like extracellular domain-containing protein n=1 Tax=Lentzea alba TaxID=2714351 RepID=A0A7C9VWY4_9PSEU|nr:hypothetical protein [Lentzea alba]NGY59100.1 hypothetical protein [Lentzea alba]